MISSNLLIKLEWYKNRLLSELFLRKVIRAHRPFFKGTVKHSLPSRLIVSLTSYKPRFATLPPTIYGLIRQSVVPDELILWVSADDYPYVPNELIQLQGEVNDQGTVFAIKQTTDLGPYKKVIPTLNYAADAFIVTADDDIYYSYGWLAGLIGNYDGDPHQVVAYKTHQITLDPQSQLPMPYNHWQINKEQQVDAQLGFALGVGGVLYPPASLHPQVLDEDCFQQICPMADDIWLFWMARLNGTVVKKTKQKFTPICWPSSQEVGLFHSNVQNSANATKVDKMIRQFGWPIADR